MEDIEKILGFIVEIEKLKDVHRKTKPVGLDRFENSAEHSWHVCLTALMLKDFANEKIDINRVIKMLLIHDLGEIDVGDTIIYANETSENKAKEFLALWHEFEAGETADSCFAKAIDRVPPLLHNIHGGGHSWEAHGITKEKVFSVNQRIEAGSKELWSVMHNKLEDAVHAGILK